MQISKLLLRYAPVPRFLSMPSVGVDVSDSSLKYVLLAGRGSRARPPLARWGASALPSGIITDGAVTDRARFVRYLAGVRHAAGVRHIRLGLPEKHAYIFETEISKNASLREVRGELEFRLEEHVPLSPRDALLAYEVVPAFGGEDGAASGERRVAVTAYRKDVLVGYYNACRAAGFVPLAFEVESQAIARAVTPPQVDRAMLVLDLGERYTRIGIVSSGTLCYAHTLDRGDALLGATLREVLGDCSEADITTVKNTHGLLGTHPRERVNRAIRAHTALFVDALRARITYWATERRTVEELVLVGGGANLAGLPKHLTEVLGIPTRRANVWQNVCSHCEWVPPLSHRVSYGYATAIGLALGGDA